MDKQVGLTINLFDHYTLRSFHKWNYHQDGIPGTRVMFVTNEKDDTLITFDEGMDLEKIFRTPQETDAVCYHAAKHDKQIHMVRCKEAHYGFFCIEFSDSMAETRHLPGQIVTSPAYKWSEGMEPVLIELLDSIYLTK